MIYVAAEMTRRGMKLPLLIGGATTSGKHTAVKIAPAYTGATVHVPDASLAVGVLGKLLSGDARDLPRRGRREAGQPPRDALRQLAEAPAARATRSRARAAPSSSSRRREVPTPRSRACKTSSSSSRELARLDRLVAVLPHLGALRPLPRDPRRSEEGRRRAQGVRRRPGAARDRIIATNAAPRRAPPTGSSRPRATATTSRCSTPTARRELAPVPDAAPARGQGRLPLARGLHRAARLPTDPSRLPRRVHRDRRARHRRARRPRSSATTTTTTRSWPRRSPIASPRPSPSGSTTARVVDWGYGDDRGPDPRRHPRREVPRHPPRVRLSRVPRPRAEGHAVRAARPRGASRRHG